MYRQYQAIFKFYRLPEVKTATLSDKKVRARIETFLSSWVVDFWSGTCCIIKTAFNYAPFTVSSKKLIF